MFIKYEFRDWNINVNNISRNKLIWNYKNIFRVNDNFYLYDVFKLKIKGFIFL